MPIRAYKLAEQLGLDRKEFVRRAGELGVDLQPMTRVDDGDAFIRGGPWVKTGPRRGRRMSLAWCERLMIELRYCDWVVDQIETAKCRLYTRAREFGVTRLWSLDEPIVGDSA